VCVCVCCVCVCVRVRVCACVCVCVCVCVSVCVSHTQAHTHSGEVDANLRAWATYKRALVQKVCEAQAADDLRGHKRQRAGEAAGGGGGLTGAALKDALLAQHRAHFVPASCPN
jgi:hypothetical protein